MLMGTPEAHLAAFAAEEMEPHVQVHDDFAEETEYATAAGFVDLISRPEVQEKLQRRYKAALLKEMNPPRPGKKCAVFDIDYVRNFDEVIYSIIRKLF